MDMEDAALDDGSIEADIASLLGVAVEHPKWSAYLEDAQAMADYIVEHASGYIDEEFVREYYRGSAGVLRRVPIEHLVEGDPDHNERSPKKEARYAKKKPETMPPLMVEMDGTVTDGNHRLRVSRQNGQADVLCYVSVYEELAQRLRMDQQAPSPRP